VESEVGGDASAGAYLGSLLALTAGAAHFEGTVGGNLDQSSEVQAVVHWFGQSDLLAAGSRSEVEARLLPFTFGAGHEGPEFDRPDSLAMTAGWLQAKLSVA
jgi:BD-FAE